MKHIGHRIALSALLLTQGVTIACASPEGPVTYNYRICGRVIDLLQDLSGDKNTDRRRLTAKLSGDPAWKSVIFDRISFVLTPYGEPPAKAALPAGIIDNVLEVYLSTDKTKKECRESGCTASLTYNNGSQFFTHDEKLAIDGQSIIYAVIGPAGGDVTTPLNLNLYGAPKSIDVEGRREKFSIFQNGVFIPCPAPDAHSPKCESFLGNLPQDKFMAHDNFQTVMTGREDLAKAYKLGTCEKVYEEFKLEAPH